MRIRHVPESLSPICSTCPIDQLRAWQIGYTVAPRREGFDRVSYEFVVAREGRAVTAFVFVDTPHRLSGSKKLVGVVLARD